jgi:hypothetical protein
MGLAKNCIFEPYSYTGSSGRISVEFPCNSKNSGDSIENYDLLRNNLGLIHPPPIFGERAYFLPPSTLQIIDRKLSPIPPSNDGEENKEVKENLFNEVRNQLENMIPSQAYYKCSEAKKYWSLKKYEINIFSHITDREQYDTIPNYMKVSYNNLNSMTE